MNCLNLILNILKLRYILLLCGSLRLICNTNLYINLNFIQKNTTNLYLGVCQPATTDTSNHLFLKRSIAILSKKLATSTKNVKVLQQKLKWQYHKLTLLKQIVFQLKEKNKINDDASKMLLNNFGKHIYLITN